MRTIKRVKQIICGYFDIHEAEYFVRDAIRDIYRGHWKSAPYSSSFHSRRFKITVETIDEDD